MEKRTITIYDDEEAEIIEWLETACITYLQDAHRVYAEREKLTLAEERGYTEEKSIYLGKLDKFIAILQGKRPRGRARQPELPMESEDDDE